MTHAELEKVEQGLRALVPVTVALAHREHWPRAELVNRLVGLVMTCVRVSIGGRARPASVPVDETARAEAPGRNRELLATINAWLDVNGRTGEPALDGLRYAAAHAPIDLAVVTLGREDQADAER